MFDLANLLQPIADFFSSFGLPTPIVRWGHPLMMGTVIFAMGSFVGWSGWRGRLAADAEVESKNRSSHRKLAPWMFLFLALGYTGGILSLVMQGHPLLESPHFWTGSLVLVLLASNGAISLSGFGGNKAALRTAHAYLGSLALATMLVHTFLGLDLGLSL